MGDTRTPHAAEADVGGARIALRWADPRWLRRRLRGLVDSGIADFLQFLQGPEN